MTTANLPPRNCLGTWVAQLVERPTLDFHSGHDPVVPEIEPHVGLCAVSEEPAWDSPSLLLSLPLPHLCTHSLSLSKSILKKKKNSNLANDDKQIQLVKKTRIVQIYELLDCIWQAKNTNSN